MSIFFKVPCQRKGGTTAHQSEYQRILSILGLSFFSLALPTPVTAQCPVCIVTVGGGMLLAKKLGVDDLLVAIWISALNTAISYWAAFKIKIKLLNNPFILSVLMYLTTLIYFNFTDQLLVPSNTVLGIDKILLGMTFGMLSLIIGYFVYNFARSKNNGKALFPYSKVVFPVGTVLLTTLIFKLTFNL